MITKDKVAQALGALEAASPEIAKSGDGDLNSANGAADGGGDGSLKAPGTDMNGKGKKTKKSLAKAFPPKKAADGGDDEGDDEGDEGDDEGDDDDGDAEPKAKKSFARDLPEEIKTKIDVSAFLKSLVDHNSQSLDTMRKAIVKSASGTSDQQETILDSIADLQKSLGNVGVVLRAMCERMGMMENQPQVQKSVSSTAQAVAKSQTTAQPVSREFVGTEPAEEQTGLYKSLNGKPAHVAKAMISEALCQLVMKGEAKDTDVINFETSGFVPNELDAKLRTALN